MDGRLIAEIGRPTADEKALIERAERILSGGENLRSPAEASLLIIELDSRGKVQLHRRVCELVLERWPESEPARRYREEQQELERDAAEAARLKEERTREEAERAALIRFRANGMIGKPPIEIPIAWVRKLLETEARVASTHTDSRASMKISLLHQERRSFVKAAAFAQRAAELDAHDSTRLRYGAALRRLGLTEDAQRVYGDVLSRDPNSFRAWTALAAVRADQGSLEDAKIAINSVLAKRPDDPHALLVAGRVARKQGDLRASEQFFSRARQHGANEESLDEQLRKLARAIRQRGNGPEAARIERQLT